MRDSRNVIENYKDRFDLHPMSFQVNDGILNTTVILRHQLQQHYRTR